MTRKRKTRSLADKVTIRTGKRKDYRRWRHDNPDEVSTTSRRFVSKKTEQRKEQAERKRQRQSAPPLPLHKGDGDPEGSR
ncbi:hypothetical protein [Salinicola halophilus]|uniref:hypothetical protein n=1 Tax=Salinicola halophilus TaxID=184065 RepID=UPI000DA1721F|nr:hypothetical protein [Salinicola halophilus]